MKPQKVDGRLLNAPHFTECDGFSKSDFSLYPVGLETWGGFFFLNLSPEPGKDCVTLQQQLGEATTRVQRYPLRRQERHGSPREIWVVRTFFCHAGQINKEGFLNRAQICRLRGEGHVIGSHSFSHPVRMSHCSNAELTEEWTKSIKILSEILGEQVDTASVAGGYYSNRVGETAAVAGIRVLFNSEPTTTVHTVAGCLVVGRYNIFRGTELAFRAIWLGFIPLRVQGNGFIGMLRNR